MELLTMSLLLQEEQTADFDPQYICGGQPPLYTRLFVLYIFAVLIFAAVRSIQMGWGLWKMRSQKIASLDPAAILLHCEAVSVRIKTLKNLALLTFLLSLAHLAMSLSGVMDQVRIQKTTGFGAIALGIMQSLHEFSAGIIICTIVFFIATIFESNFKRHLPVQRELQRELSREPRPAIQAD